MCGDEVSRPRAARRRLAPGKQLYKFVVDGVWLTDLDNPNKESDGDGNGNSVLVKN